MEIEIASLEGDVRIRERFRGAAVGVGCKDGIRPVDADEGPERPFGEDWPDRPGPPEPEEDPRG